MEIRIRSTGQVVSEEAFVSMWANDPVTPKTLPKQLTPQVLNDLGADPVLASPQPEASPTQMVIRNGVMQDSNGNWVVRWGLVNLDPTVIADQKAEAISQRWEDIKTERERRISGGVKVLINGTEHWFHSDMKSKIQHLANKDTARDQIIAGGALSDPLLDEETSAQIIWKTLTPAGEPDVWIPLTCGIAYDIAKACKSTEFATHKAAEILKAQMAASANPASYNFMQDEANTKWPVIFEDVFGTQA